MDFEKERLYEQHIERASCSRCRRLCYRNDRERHGADREKIEHRLASIQAKTAAASSNPYDDIKNNADFESLVGLGHEALPFLQKKLSNSTNNGLQEYITAIAIERIAKVDLKKQDATPWETAKAFNEKWKHHLKSVPPFR